MSKIKEVIFDIEQDIRSQLYEFPTIASKHNVPVSFVNQVWELMCQQEAQVVADNDYFDDYCLGDERYYANE